MKCDICSKSPQTGNNVSHSKRRTKRLFEPNIQKAQLMIDGRLQQRNVCTSCLRTLAKVR